MAIGTEEHTYTIFMNYVITGHHNRGFVALWKEIRIHILGSLKQTFDYEWKW